MKLSPPPVPHLPASSSARSPPCLLLLLLASSLPPCLPQIWRSSPKVVPDSLKSVLVPGDEIPARARSKLSLKVGFSLTRKQKQRISGFRSAAAQKKGHKKKRGKIKAPRGTFYHNCLSLFFSLSSSEGDEFRAFGYARASK